MNQIRRAYGLWDSPITPLSLARRVRFSDVAWDQSGALVWREERAERGVLVVQPPDGEAPRDLNAELSAQAKVGYGGGDFGVGSGVVYFAEAESGRIFRQSLQPEAPRPITPAFGHAASPKLSPDGRWLLFVHTYEGEDSLAIVDAEGKCWPQKLVSGDDFYMQPAWHPDGQRIAWIAWNHPNMPWDGTFLRMGRLTLGEGTLPTLGEVSTLAGGEEISVMQPEFSPDGRYLAYVSDASGWWHLYLYDLERGEHRPLTSGEAEDGRPAWIQGLRSYSFSPDGKSLFFIRNKRGFASLWRVEVPNGKAEHLPLEAQYTWLEQIAVAPDGQRLALLASGAQTPTRVIIYTLSNAEVQVVRRSSPENLPPSTYSTPQAISWKGMDGEEVYGLFYPPQNERFSGVGLPPLIVLVHGGPTSQRPATFDPQTHFFTSRGYAVLEVNYRGSTGYGRDYRDKLRGNWGIYDVQDSVSGARYLAQRGLVDEHKMVIMGGSAGGFTVLKALEDYPGFFKAGIDLFGVSNQFALAMETHKFELHYNDRLLGPLPEAAALYRERSPLFFAERIQDPIAIFQGEVDRVVPRNQSDEVVESLRRRGVPHIYHVYPGEGHGFRKAETLEHFYREVEKFLRQYVILT